MIDLAAVGLWLPRLGGGGVAHVGDLMIAVEFLFPQIFGGRLWVIVVELVMLGAYLGPR